MLDLLVVVLPLLLGALVVTGFLAVKKTIRAARGDDAFAETLREITTSELDNSTSRQSKTDVSWSQFWYEKASKSGAHTAPGAPGRNVLVSIVVAFGFGTLVTGGGFLAGFVAAVAAPVLWLAVYNRRAKRRASLIDKQLPNLIFNMRANLQSNFTPQQALLSVVDDMPAPLGTELAILRDEVNVNIPLSTALNKLAERASSREMKFLVSSILVASNSGSDLDPQLKTIQGILSQRARVAGRLATAIASVSPALIISAVFVPGGFLFSYLSNADQREFWFSFSGMVSLMIVAVLYVIGLFVTRKFISNVENT